MRGIGNAQPVSSMLGEIVDSHWFLSLHIS